MISQVCHIKTPMPRSDYGNSRKKSLFNHDMHNEKYPETSRDSLEPTVGILADNNASLSLIYKRRMTTQQPLLYVHFMRERKKVAENLTVHTALAVLPKVTFHCNMMHMLVSGIEGHKVKGDKSLHCTSEGIGGCRS